MTAGEIDIGLGGPVESSKHQQDRLGPVSSSTEQVSSAARSSTE